MNKKKLAILYWILAIMVLLIVIFGWVLYKHLETERAQKEVKTSIDTQNDDTIVNLNDGHMSVILPCKPGYETAPLHTEDMALGSANCTEVIDYNQAKTRIYTASYTKYLKQVINEQDYLQCTPPAGDGSVREQLSTVYNSNETINGNVFKVCAYAGDIDSYYISATIISNDTVYIFKVLTNEGAANKLWPAFRNMLETYRVV